MYKCVTTQVVLYTGSWSPSHVDLCHFRVSVSVPLEWGHQMCSCFGFSIYPHTSRMCSPLVMWPKSNSIAVNFNVLGKMNKIGLNWQGTNGSDLSTQKAKIKRIDIRSQPQQIVHKTLSQKYPTQKRAGRVTQVLEHLPSKHEALTSNPSTTQKKDWNMVSHCSILQDVLTCYSFIKQTFEFNAQIGYCCLVSV
jgi:hypothetical protein